MKYDFFILHFFRAFFVFFGGRKTAAANFRNTTYHNKTFGVDAVGEVGYFCNFAVGNNGKNDLSFVMFIAGFGIKKCYASVDLGKDGIGDLFCLSGDDFEFGSGFAHNKGLIKNEGINASENNAVKDAVHGFEHCKKNDDDKIESIKACGNGDVEKLIEYQRGDIHSAGGSAGADNKAEGESDAEAAEDGAKENIVGKDVIAENLVAYFKEDRVTERAENCGGGEGLAENEKSKAEHSNIKSKNKGGNGNTKEVFDDEGDTGGSAKGNTGREYKKLYAQGINDIAKNNAGKGE